MMLLAYLIGLGALGLITVGYYGNDDGTSADYEKEAKRLRE